MPIDRNLLQNMNYTELVALAERQLRQISNVNQAISIRESTLQHRNYENLHFSQPTENDHIGNLQLELESQKKVLTDKDQLSANLSTEIAKLSEKLERRRLKRILDVKQAEIKLLDQKINKISAKLETKRPQAQVEPFSRPKNNEEVDYLTSKGFLTAFSAVEETLLAPKVPNVNFTTNRRSPPVSNRRFCMFLGPSQQNSLNNSSDDHPPPDLIPNSEKEVFNSNNHQYNSNLAIYDPDSIAIRNDTIRAIKRRSWADPHHHHYNFEQKERASGSEEKEKEKTPRQNDEAENIKALLWREQQKGRSTVNLSWIFGQLPSHVENNMEKTLTETKPTYCNVGKVSNQNSTEEMEEMQENQSEQNDDEISGKMSSKKDINVTDFPAKQENQDLVTNIDIEPIGGGGDENQDDIEMANASVIIVSESSTFDENVKSILKKNAAQDIDPEKERIRRLQFDPLALLLDASLEGELETVKICAQKLGTVSKSNAEGITALHNAICAGHYDVVRFLVEAGADVNAHDSDGWTPLHCAASCNNLPTVKFLVERGACPFAATFNDAQTPVEKCEEDAEGFDGCCQYLHAIQRKMGRELNGARVFGAFDFDARALTAMDCASERTILDGNDSSEAVEKLQQPENNIELEEYCWFRTGEELLVLSKNETTEENWWTVQSLDAKKSGLAPRNYLTLYPKCSTSIIGKFEKIETEKLGKSEEFSIEEKYTVCDVPCEE